MTRGNLLAMLLVLAGSWLVGGCAMFGKKKSEAPEATLPTWLGRVVMVDEVHRFALVDTGSRTVPAAGVNVFTLREQQKTSTLRATGEARPPYLALELVEGLPAIGDQAVLDESHALADSPPLANP